MENFTEKANEALNNAKTAAASLGHSYIGTEHILLGLMDTKNSAAADAIEAQNITYEDLVEKIEGMIGSDDLKKDSPEFTPGANKVIRNSYDEAKKSGSDYVGTEHILLSIINEPDCVAMRLLTLLGANTQRLFEDIATVVSTGDSSFFKGLGKNDAENSDSSTPTLDKYSRDFTRLAANGKFDPIVGRKDEIERLIQILSRRTKNNPCLVGDPGVGKTAIVEGMAQKIIIGDIPETLKGRRVVSLDLAAMVAGTKYRGEFEERIEKVINEVKSDGKTILFIDELHTIIGAGGAEGAIDASNILKPSLSRGELQLIGATTLEEYRKYIEKDAALERRFQPVTVEEPTEKEAIEMLMGLKGKYESHHSVKITDSAIELAVKMSARYIRDRFLPDKAIDVIDEAASKLRLKNYTPPKDIKEFEERLIILKNEKEEAMKSEDFEKAVSIRNEENQIKEKLKTKKQKWEEENKNAENVLDEENVADIISKWTGIPLKSIRQEESARLLNLEAVLTERVIGQHEAIHAVSRAIRRGRVGLKDPDRPIGSFLFLGPTGVGKTELSKALTEALFGDEDAIIRIDMSEYMEKHSVSKLIGSPPGYVGYEEGGQLSEKVRRKPYSVVLFDEIEKASPDVFNILLQILDDGHITDAQGRKVSFKNTVIIMTSNAGARSILNPKRLGFNADDSAEKSYEAMKSSVMEEVKNIFKPEFINRIDEIIVFHSLTFENIADIVRLMSREIIARVKENMGINLKFTDEAIIDIAKVGFDVQYGARPLRRALQARVEDVFAEKYLGGLFARGDTVIVGIDGKELTFEKE
ncbi:MAG: ATP-dependent Clp protease ATP-binding subunit [Lachnospiraceae bacterium]|nr:ATP-dependent Clp protease ATP-binding subunit [Lachnospiraceae bacterium]